MRQHATLFLFTLAIILVLLSLIPASNGEKEPIWSHPTSDSIRAVDISDDGEYIVSGGRDQRVKLFQRNSSEPIWEFESEEIIYQIDISADGKYIAAKSSNGRIYVFHTNDSMPLWWRDMDTLGGKVRISDDGDKIIVSDNNDYLYLYDKDDPSYQWRYFIDITIGDIGISSDGEYIVAGGNDNEVHLFGNDIPEARIYHIKPDVALVGEEVEFREFSQDDGYPERIVWSSDHDGEIYNGTESIFTLSNLSQNIHAISLKVQDCYGVWSEEVFDSLVVHKPPVANISAILPEEPNEGDEITFQGNGTDDGIVVKYSWFSSLDDDLYFGPANNFSRSDLSPGAHIITLKVQDNNGEWSENAQYELFINAAPKATYAQLSQDLIAETEFVIANGHGIDDQGVEEFRWRVVNSSGVEVYTESNKTINFSAEKYPDLVPGNYTFYFGLRDANDVWSPELERSLTIHQTPIAFIHSVSPSPALAGEPLTFDWSYEDDGEYHIRYWRYRNGSGPLITSGNRPPYSLPAGSYTIFLKVRDDHEVWSEEVSIQLLVHERPEAAIVEIIPSTVRPNDPIRFLASASDDGEILRYQWRSTLTGILYDGPNSAFNCSANSCLNLSIGIHTIGLTVQDDLGAWSQEVFSELIISEVPNATILAIDPDPQLQGREVTFHALGLDLDGIALYVWRSSIDGEFYNGSDYLIQHSQLSEGNHTITLQVMDTRGLWSDPVTAELTIDRNYIGKSGLSVEILNPGTEDVVSGNVTFNGTARDDQYGIHSVEVFIQRLEWREVGEITLVSPGNYTWSYTWNSSELNPGRYLVSVRASNGYESSGRPSIYIIVEDPLHPEDNKEPEGKVPLGEAVAMITVSIGILGICGLILYYNVYKWPKVKARLISKYGFCSWLSKNWDDISHILTRPKVMLFLLLGIFLLREWLTSNFSTTTIGGMCFLLVIIPSLLVLVKRKFFGGPSKGKVSVGRTINYEVYVPPPPPPLVSPSPPTGPPAAPPLPTGPSASTPPLFPPSPLTGPSGVPPSKTVPPTPPPPPMPQAPAPPPPPMPQAPASSSQPDSSSPVSPMSDTPPPPTPPHPASRSPQTPLPTTPITPPPPDNLSFPSTMSTTPPLPATPFPPDSSSIPSQRPASTAAPLPRADDSYHAEYDPEDLIELQDAHEQLLAYAKEFGFLLDWDLERFRSELWDSHGELPKGPEDLDMVEDLIIAPPQGFSLDWKFSCNDVIRDAGGCLKDHGIELSMAGSATDRDAILSKDPVLRGNAIRYGDEVKFIEFSTPRDIIREVNDFLQRDGLIFLDADRGGDSYEFILVDLEVSERILQEGLFSFKEVMSDIT